MNFEKTAKSGQICLSTVTTDSFVPGTLVTLYTFIKYNKWFKGEIVIFHDGLTDENKNYLSNIHPRVSFLGISEKIKAKAEKIAEEFPGFAKKKARFYSLETFRLRDFEKILFIDSDLLFRDSVGDLLELDHDFIVCGDGFHYQERKREWLAIPGDPPVITAETHLFDNTFNSGFMIISNKFLNDAIYEKLLNLIDARLFRKNTAKLADQMVLNVYFAGKQHIVSAKYNFVLAHRRAIQKFEGLTQNEASVFHFNGSVKPCLCMMSLLYYCSVEWFSRGTSSTNR